MAKTELPNVGSWSLLSSFSLSVFFQKITRIEKFPIWLKTIPSWKLDLVTYMLGVFKQVVTELRSLRFYTDKCLPAALLSFQISNRLLNKGCQVVPFFTSSPSSFLVHSKTFFWSAFMLSFAPAGMIRLCQSIESRVLEANEWGRQLTTRKMPWDMNCFN